MFGPVRSTTAPLAATSPAACAQVMLSVVAPDCAMAPVENVDTMMNAMIGFMWGSSRDTRIPIPRNRAARQLGLGKWDGGGSKRVLKPDLDWPLRRPRTQVATGV